MHPISKFIINNVGKVYLRGKIGFAMNPTLIKKNLLVFLFCFSLTIGAGYTMYVHYDFSHSTDTESYMNMAKGEFDVNSVHRYRIVVPFISAAVAAPVNLIYTKLWPHRADSDWPLRLAFYLVNSFLLALSGTIIFFTCQAYHASFTSSLIAVAIVLSSRWAVYISALPLIDSFYILVVCLLFFGLKTESKLALGLSIVLGPFAKESFIFIAPLILFFGRNVLNLKTQIPLFVASGVAIFGIRYLIDLKIGSAYHENLDMAFDTLNDIARSFFKLASIRGIGELFSVFGIFTLILIAGVCGGKESRYSWTSKTPTYLYLFFIPILIHVLLSGEAARMIYIAAPVFAVFFSLILDHHPYFNIYRQWKRETDKIPLQKSSADF